MANKQVNQSYTGMVKDITKSKFSNESYYDAHNIRIMAIDNQSTLCITNEKGNEKIFDLNDFPVKVTRNANNADGGIISYGNKSLAYTVSQSEMNTPNSSNSQKIIGQVTTRDKIVLFSTDGIGFDCIWTFPLESINANDLLLVYTRNLGFNELFPIYAINNFEGAYIDKIYWIDGKSQVQFLNLKQSISNDDPCELIDVPRDSIQMSCSFTFKQPIIKSIERGGTHTAGMIQYAYNLYRVNSSQSKLSPLSELVPLDKGIEGGGEVNSVVAAAPVIRIEDIDKDYTNIRVYAIKYTSYNQTPSISVILDSLIPGDRNIEVFDDGGVIFTLTLEQLLFLGSDVIIPKHMNTKFNRLLLANLNEKNLNIDMDMRAYSFDNDPVTPEAFIYEDIYLDQISNNVTGTLTVVTPSSYDAVDKTNDCINLNTNKYNRQANGLTYGGEGKYVKYELWKTMDNGPEDKFFKDEEFYRLGIQFYNEFGQITLPIWVADFKALEGNLLGYYNALKFELKQQFFIDLPTYIDVNDPYAVPVGYKVLIAERTVNDKTIVANGMLSTMCIIDNTIRYPTWDQIKDLQKQRSKIPNFLARNSGFYGTNNSHYGSTGPLRQTENGAYMSFGSKGTNYTEMQVAWNDDVDKQGRGYQFNSMVQMYSPEITFNEPVVLTPSLKIRLKGAYKNTVNNSWGTCYRSDGTAVSSGTVYNGVSWNTPGCRTEGTQYAWDWGMVAPPGGNYPDQQTTSTMWYRGYGPVDTSLSGPAVPNIVKLGRLDYVNYSDPLIQSKYIQKTGDGYGILYTLDANNIYNNIRFSIVPDLGYEGVQYTVKLMNNSYTEDVSEGAFQYAAIVGTTGSQNLSYTIPTFVPDPNTGLQEVPYYLWIQVAGSTEFKCGVEITGWESPAQPLSYIGPIDDVNPGYDTNPLNVATIEMTKVNFSINTVNPGDHTTNLILPQFRIEYEIYGSPELTNVGQDFKSYNRDNRFRYSNSLQSMTVDGANKKFSDDDDPFQRSIVSVNSHGQRCITMVFDENNNNPADRNQLETMFFSSGIGGEDNLLIAELVKNDEEIYLGNIYGGNSWEDKKRTPYIEIGEYTSFALTDISSKVTIQSPGDTRVGMFRFQRISRKDSQNHTFGYFTAGEIVEYPTETTIDLKNRNDLSLAEWNTKFQPTISEYQQYNRVYSQMANFIRRVSLDYNIKKVNEYDNKVIISFLKTPGELIDNWTDTLVNETLNLDGKHGAINALVSLNDELYTIQDKAIAFLSIQPRIQVSGSDGLAVQLGEGKIMDRFQYIVTNKGTLNKWSVVVTNQAFYFYDIISNSFNMFSKEGVVSISDSKQMKSFFNTETEPLVLKKNNPLIKQGISGYYDDNTGDVFATFHQIGKPSFTVCYNEFAQSFTSFYSFHPSLYTGRGINSFTINPTNTALYKQRVGKYGVFYGTKYPWSVTLNINPESTKSCVFDNIEFKSDVTLDGADQPLKTINYIRAYNDYQNSGATALVENRNGNLRRKFREWNALIPREGRYRIRAPYIKLEFGFKDNGDGDFLTDYRFVFHDSQISYTV